MRRIVTVLLLAGLAVVFVAGCTQTANSGSCESCKKAHPEYFQKEEPWVEQK